MTCEKKKGTKSTKTFNIAIKQSKLWVFIVVVDIGGEKQKLCIAAELTPPERMEESERSF